jgi:hypothetical protein
MGGGQTLNTPCHLKAHKTIARYTLHNKVILFLQAVLVEFFQVKSYSELLAQDDPCQWHHLFVFY